MSQVQDVTPDELHAWMEAGAAILIDVRDVEEYQDARIPGSVLIPLESCGPAALPHNPDKRIVFHCKVGKRGAKGAQACIAAAPQRVVYNLAGGIEAWAAAGHPVERGTDAEHL